MYVDEEMLEDLVPEEEEELEELLGFMQHLPGIAPGEQFSGGNLRTNDEPK